LNPVFLTLAIEFQFYILLMLLFPILVQKGWTSYAAYAVLIALGGVLPGTFFEFAPFFILGIMVFKRFIGIVGNRELWLVVLLLEGLIWLKLGIVVTLICLATVGIILLPIRKWVIFSFLGDISYSLYLIHAPIGGRVINLGSRFAESALEQVGVVIGAAVLSLFSAWLLFRFVEQPCQKFAGKMRYRKPGFSSVPGR